jgi:hypothetical protein
VTKGMAINMTTNDAAGCERLCCDLGKECISWQYWEHTEVCKVGGQIRLGMEAAPTPNWCDPIAPHKWNGKKIGSRKLAERGGDATCTWGDDTPTQCFGLGPERMNAGSRMNADQCARACCNDPTCTMWQHQPDRGCYYNTRGSSKTVEDIHCDPDILSFQGGRKNITKLNMLYKSRRRMLRSHDGNEIGR